MHTKKILRTLAAAGTLWALTDHRAANAADNSPGELGIIPKPVKVETGAGSFPLSPQCRILYQRGSPGAKAAAEYLADTWRTVLGFPLPVQGANESKRGSILLTTAAADGSLGKEGYRLEVTPQGGVIRAPHADGLFYGLQTLRQLLPAETFGSTRIARQGALPIPCVRIGDYPRFRWRGMHLDVSRHFLEGVFGELADLFPDPYIHVGGDERPKGPWEQCDRCRKRMKEENLPDGRFLQDRFLKRLQDFLRTCGKQMVGWDELEQESVLDKDYIGMAWQSVQAGLAAARKGYPVVVAPAPFTYFDLACSEDPAEPGQRWAGVVSVAKTYSFDPKPADLAPDAADRILGVEGCLWSETLVTPDRPDYMAYPRACALAEVAWTPQRARVWPEFWSRLCQQHLARLDAGAIGYRIPLPTARQSGAQITITPPYDGAQVRCTLDGSAPGPNSMLYTQPFDLAKDQVLKMRTFRPNGRASRTITGAEPVGPRP
jgi:N-acetyl-beta-hexosaminidase